MNTKNLTVVMLLVCSTICLCICLISEFEMDSSQVNINTVLCNLSYSFIAVCIFYLLTVLLPDYYLRKKFKSTISENYTLIIVKFASILSLINKKEEHGYVKGEVPRDIMIKDINSYDKKQLEENLHEILLNYFIEKNNSESLSLLSKINYRIDEIKVDCDKFLINYPIILTDKQISHINAIRTSEFWDWFGYYINLDICCNSFYEKDSDKYSTKEEFKEYFRARNIGAAKIYCEKLQEIIRDTNDNQKKF